MTKDLFRKEAIRHRTRALFGDVILAAPISTWLITGLLALILACLITFSFVGTIEQRTEFQASISPPFEDIRPRVSHPISFEPEIGSIVRVSPVSPTKYTETLDAIFSDTMPFIHRLDDDDTSFTHSLSYLDFQNERKRMISLDWAQNHTLLNISYVSGRQPIWRWALGLEK